MSKSCIENIKEGDIVSAWIDRDGFVCGPKDSHKKYCDNFIVLRSDDSGGCLVHDRKMDWVRWIYHSFIVKIKKVNI